MKRSKNNNWLWVIVLILLFQLGKWMYRHDWSQNNKNSIINNQNLKQEELQKIFESDPFKKKFMDKKNN